MNRNSMQTEGNAMRYGNRATAALIVGIVLFGFWGCAPEGQEREPVDVAHYVRVMTVAPVDVSEYFEISGPLAAVRGADISAEEAGVVAAIPLRKGARAEAGAVLVELDRRMLEAEMEAAGANLELQAYNAEKTAKLFEAGKVSEIQMLEARSAAEQARSQSRIARLRYERAAVAAPFKGVVADRYVELGQLVMPGTRVARVIDPYTLKLNAALTEREIRWVEEGALTRVYIEGSGESVQGRVHWVALEADLASGKFKVEIRVDNSDLKLRSGVVGRARVHKVDHSGVTALPRDAILMTPTGSAVYVVEGDRADLRGVELGPDQGLMVVVTDGLGVGEQVVVRGHRDLVDGALVRVTAYAETADGSNADDPAEVTDAETRRDTGDAGEGIR